MKNLRTADMSDQMRENIKKLNIPIAAPWMIYTSQNKELTDFINGLQDEIERLKKLNAQLTTDLNDAKDVINYMSH